MARLATCAGFQGINHLGQSFDKEGPCAVFEFGFYEAKIAAWFAELKRRIFACQVEAACVLDREFVLSGGFGELQFLPKQT